MQPPVSYPPKSFCILFFKVGGAVVLMFLAWALMFWLFSEQAFVSARQFSDNGETVNANVVNKYSEFRRDADGHRNTYYFLDLEYETRNGEAISLDRLVTRSEYDQVEPGDVIGIIYLRNDPETIEVTTGSNLSMGVITRKFAWLSVLFVLVGTWINGRRALDAVRAREKRQREEVSLIEVRKKGWWIFSKGYRLIWCENTGRKGQSLTRAADKLMGFRPGDTLVVFHGDQRSWWAGDIGDRKGA
ncbi:MAG: DUF3592 domain-containing protein [Paracoccaceae bacterium]